MKLEIFKNKTFGSVRVLAGDKGESWFVAKDVCDILGLSDVSMSLKKLDEDEKLIQKLFVSGQYRNIWLINESGFYSLVLRSNKSQAKKFKKWVTSEVLPAIRKHGLYATDEVIEKTINDPDFMIELLQELKKEKTEKQKLAKKVNILTHSDRTYTSTEIAKELGFKSAIELNKKLHEMGIQYKSNNTWVLYSKYADKGFGSIKQITLPNKRAVYDRRWTQKGREFLLSLFQNSTKQTPALQDNKTENIKAG